MCGIVGFTGTQQAAPILLESLSKLEYRGYDSAGLAVRDGSTPAEVVKAKGRLSNLIEKTDGGTLCWEPAASGIPGGQPTESPARPMPTPMSPATAPAPVPVRWRQRWLVSTTALLRTMPS